MRILILEDHRLTADCWATILTSAGHEVVTCHTGQEAIRRRADWRPDILMLDLRLPDGPGTLFLERLRVLCDKEGLGHIPCIITSGVADHELQLARDYIESHGLGPYYLLQKPVEAMDLIELLRIIEHVGPIQKVDVS